jgi:predicted HAD superfamily hydrolase
MSETSIVKKSILSEWKQIIKNEKSIMTKVNVSFLNTPIYLSSHNLINQTIKNIYKNLLNSQNISILLGFSIWLNK